MGDPKKSDFFLVVTDNDLWAVQLARFVRDILPDQILCIDGCINVAHSGMIVANLTLLMQDEYFKRPVRFALTTQGSSLIVHCHSR